MWSILKGEWHKLRRCQILLVGIVALTLCPVAQYGVQLLINPELQDQSFDFLKLFANVIWGNTQIFLPISLVMIGGWLIDRENTNDTMKNLLTVPVSYLKLLVGKLIVTVFLSLLFGIYSVVITVLTGSIAGLDGLSAAVLLRQGVQVIVAAFNKPFAGDRRCDGRSENLQEIMAVTADYIRCGMTPASIGGE